MDFQAYWSVAQWVARGVSVPTARRACRVRWRSRPSWPCYVVASWTPRTTASCRASTAAPLPATTVSATARPVPTINCRPLADPRSVWRSASVSSRTFSGRAPVSSVSHSLPSAFYVAILTWEHAVNIHLRQRKLHWTFNMNATHD